MEKVNSPKIKKARSVKFSEAENEQLKIEVAARKGILFAAFTSTITYKVKENEWELVAAAVNKVGGNNRSAEKVRTRWFNISVPAKKNLADKRKAIKLTGGGKGTKDLTPDEMRMAAILGEERIEGVPGGIDTSE